MHVKPADNGASLCFWQIHCIKHIPGFYIRYNLWKCAHDGCLCEILCRKIHSKMNGTLFYLLWGTWNYCLEYVFKRSEEKCTISYFIVKIVSQIIDTTSNTRQSKDGLGGGTNTHIMWTIQSTVPVGTKVSLLLWH